MIYLFLDKQFPEFIECPEEIDVNGNNVNGIVVNWEEPLAIDNVGIKFIIKNAVSIVWKMQGYFIKTILLNHRR